MIVGRSPCVGICSTTYGDLVCRGCKRHADEIVHWNRLDDGQRGRIWARLRALRDGAVGRFVAPLSALAATELIAQAERYGIALAPQETPAGCVYHLLRAGRLTGINVLPEVRRQHPQLTAPLLFTLIDADFERRALAQYEYAFRSRGR